jgi:thioredoxin reductase
MMVDVVIVGAGPYGLSLASHLRARGNPFRIFGSPMQTWRQHMPTGMFLKSEGFASNIDDPNGRFTLRRFCEETGRGYGDYGVPVPLDVFAAYGLWFQQHVVPELEQTDVTRIEKAGSAFVVQLASGETVSCRRVVVATGVSHFAYTPTELAQLPHTLRTHTSEHVSFDVFAGRDVAVVGAGQSALETAALLRERGAAPMVIVRNPYVEWNDYPKPDLQPVVTRVRDPITPLGAGWKLWAYMSFLPTFRLLPAATRVRVVRETLGPAGAWWLRERVEPDVPLLLGHRIVRAEAHEGAVRLELRNGDRRRELRVDHVIAGTGYRVRLDRLGFLAPELRGELRTVAGAPRLSRYFGSSVRGLFFTGLAAAHTFGPLMRFVCGTGFVSRRVARGLTAE